ncbi:sugar kinase [Flagellimonas iocasae]|uniref:Sugar kinase n=1 Tax=Flagellimonas iocasae TaxID=2055905 RepID=A0ABW4Y2N7_9FLAO
MSFVTFGEIMLRLTPVEHAAKINSAHAFDVNYAGSESNVATALGILGNKVSYVTKLPANQLGDAAMASLRSYGIGTQHISRGGKRMGTYFIELGASIRPSSVIYDRENSAISGIGENEFNWEQIFENKNWIFLSGITPVLSEQCSIETIKAAAIAKRKGVKVAFDMNFRRSLWRKSEDARIIFDQILEHTDLLFGNTGALKDVYGIEKQANNPLEETLEVAQIASEKFGIKQLALTVRDHTSASHNTVSGVFLSNGQQHISQAIDVNVLDRFGTGDAFAGAFLHGINLGWDGKEIIDFATAAFALKHTVKGDQHTSTEQEIRSVMDGNTKGHVLR